MNELLQMLVLIQGIQSPQQEIYPEQIFLACHKSINKLHDGLRESFEEKPVVLFSPPLSEGADEFKVIVYYNKKKKTITIIKVNRDGSGCILSSGTVDYLDPKGILDDESLGSKLKP